MVFYRYVFVFIFSPFICNSILDLDDLDSKEKPELIEMIKDINFTKIQELLELTEFLNDLDNKYKKLDTEHKQLQNTNYHLAATVHNQSTHLAGGGISYGGDRSSIWMNRISSGITIFILGFLAYHFIIRDWIFPDKEWEKGWNDNSWDETDTQSQKKNVN